MKKFLRYLSRACRRKKKVRGSNVNSKRSIRRNHKPGKKIDIDKVILFGSRARGDYKRTSDIDLAVEGGDVASFSLDVEEETTTLLKFDIV